MCVHACVQVYVYRHVCVRMWEWGNNMHVEGVSSLLLPRGSEGLNSGQQAWQQPPLNQ